MRSPSLMRARFTLRFSTLICWRRFKSEPRAICAEDANQSEQVEEQAHDGASSAILLDVDAAHLVASEMLECSGVFGISGGTAARRPFSRSHSR